jgi:hypothetical protein
VVDLVDLDVERERHVVAHQLEAGLVHHVVEVAPGARVEVVDNQYVVALVEQAPSQVRPDEPGSAGDQDALLRGGGRDAGHAEPRFRRSSSRRYGPAADYSTNEEVLRW